MTAKKKPAKKAKAPPADTTKGATAGRAAFDPNLVTKHVASGAPAGATTMLKVPPRGMQLLSRSSPAPTVKGK